VTDVFEDEGENVFDEETAREVQDAKTARAVLDAELQKYVERIRQAYVRTFEGGATPQDLEVVLHDLAWFCGEYDGLWRNDEREQSRALGRNEVYKRILEYTRLDPKTLQIKYAQSQA